MPQHLFAPAALAAFAAAVATPAHAQPAPATLPPVTVTGNPLQSDSPITPAAAYSGDALLMRRETTLGETLDATPGVASTYFGPNASRPVIRGLDGDRIRILNNSAGLLDASSLSYDHAVAADPIAIERIEVLRGPGALLYGGSAVGGVVNVIDSRIPRAPQPGVAGRVDIGVASGNRERGGGFAIDAGSDRYGLHADVFDRSTRDVKVPVGLDCTQGGVTVQGNRICNSASDVRGGAVGGSVFFDRGYLGLATSDYRNDYGTVAEDEVTIGLRARRHAVDGEWRQPLPGLQSIRLQAAHTDYRHTEFDAGEPGTLFSNRGNELRLEARHAPIAGFDGVIGLQADRTRFAADGEEAFAPYSRTRQRALFVYEEYALGQAGKLSFGARSEQVEVASDGNPAVARFATAQRRFSPNSAAVGGLWNVAPGWQLTANLARSQRAPKDYELFADGPHIATGAYEVGDAGLRTEKSTQFDAGVQWQSGPHKAQLSAFNNRFANYVALLGTGGTRDAEGNGAGTGVADCGDGTSAESGCTADVLPEYAYRAVRARFHGLEASGTVRLLDRAQTLDLELRADTVRATNRDTGEPLPRIAPWRAGATLAWAQGAWGARIGFDHRARQDRVPAGEAAVASYTLWNAALSYRMQAGLASLLWFARLDNASDRLAYSATSILTQTAPGKAPLPGRSLKLGVQAWF